MRDGAYYSRWRSFSLRWRGTMEKAGREVRERIYERDIDFRDEIRKKRWKLRI